MERPQAIYGIIGNPLEHSLSPVLHNTAFKELGVNAVYQLFPLKEEELKGFFSEIKSDTSPIFGLNVTVPYKEKALEYIDNTSPLVEKARAVNTIVVSPERKLIGYNTDAPGFMSHLAELQFETADKQVAIMGAGGSTRAILTALCIIPERPTSIRIYNRTPSRLEALLSDLGQRMDISIVEPVASIDDLRIETSDLLVNTTSVGMKEEDDCLVDPQLLHEGLLVYDLIYNPAETKLLKMARSCQARAANGLGMLYYQGILSLQHWANMPIDDRIKNKIREALEQARG